MAGAGWKEFPAELVPVDTGRPGLALGMGWPTRADQPSPVCAEPGCHRTAGHASLRGNMLGTRRCQNHGPMEGLCSGCGPLRAWVSSAGRDEHFLSLSRPPAGRYHRLTWQGLVSLFPPPLTRPRSLQRPCSPGLAFLSLLGSVVCPCLRLRVGGRQGRQRQAEGKKASRQGGHGDSPRSQKERRHGVVGKPAGSKGIRQRAEGREASRGLDPISATRLVGSVMHGHLPCFVQMSTEPMPDSKCKNDLRGPWWGCRMGGGWEQMTTLQGRGSD